jgi:hypothetical protein
MKTIPNMFRPIIPNAPESESLSTDLIEYADAKLFISLPEALD